MEIYTDGSTRGNGTNNARGGWAFLIKEENLVISGSEINTTNNRMELMAAANALERFEQITEEIILYTDSAYLCNCWKDEWWKSWLKNDWKNSKKQPVANQDLWERLIPFFEKPNIKFEKVKGHSGHRENEIVDKFATTAADQNLIYSENYVII